NWWLDFNDQTLNALMTQAQLQNFDMRIAEARIRKARSVLSETTASFFPATNLTGDYKKERSSGAESDLYSAKMNASWEVPIFGIGPAISASESDLQATELNAEAVRLSLQGEIAFAYFELRYAQTALKLTESTLSSREYIVDLTQARYEAGVSNAADKEQALAERDTIAARIPQFKAQAEAALRRLDVLVAGLTPELKQSLLIPGYLPQPATEIAVTTPATAINQRPDVQKARVELQKNKYLVDVANADLFPRISVNAFFGWENGSISNIFDPAGNVWRLAGGIAQPLFNFMALRERVKQADEEVQVAELTFEKSILVAVNDVETSLSGYLQEQTRLASLASATESQRKSTNLVQMRYEQGVASYIEVLTSQALLDNREQDLQQSLYQLLINR